MYYLTGLIIFTSIFKLLASTVRTYYFLYFTYLSYHDKSKRNPLCIEITAVAGSRSLKVRVAEYERRTTETIEEGRKGKETEFSVVFLRVLSQLCVTVELVV